MKLVLLLVLVLFVAAYEARQKHHIKKKESALKVSGKDGHGHKEQHHKGTESRHKMVVMGKKHRPLGASPDTINKAAWMKIANFHKADKEICKSLKCSRKELCMMNSETGETECISKRILRKRRKQMKQKRDKKEKEHRPKHKNKEVEFKKKAKELKEKAKSYHAQYEKKMKHKLKNFKHAFDYLDTPPEIVIEPKSDDTPTFYTNTVEKAGGCTQRELSEMGKRLLDWFKILQDKAKENGHHMEKRNSKKKELREDGECICQAPVSWQFLHLDADSSSALDLTELKGIESNGYEHCVTPFINACDHDSDGKLSEREWCCCFADVLPPCMAAQNKVPGDLVDGAQVILPGAHVPQCDEDGFYEPVQCHGSTGFCWCVDRNGLEVPETRTRGMPQCAKGNSNHEAKHEYKMIRDF